MGGMINQEEKVAAPDLSNEKVFPPKAKVKAVFEPSMKWHPESIRKGLFRISTELTEKYYQEEKK